jgi:hypothetical protein
MQAQGSSMSHHRIGGAVLANDLAAMGSNAELAVGVEIEDGSSAVLVLGGGVESDLAFGIQVHVQDAGRLGAFDVNPGNTLLETGVRHALLNENLAAHKQDDQAIFVPGADLVGLDEDRLGIAREVPPEAEQVSLALDRGSSGSGRGQARRERRTPRCGCGGSGAGSAWRRHGPGWRGPRSGRLGAEQGRREQTSQDGQEGTSQPSV